jgi:hypothetical protein
LDKLIRISHLAVRTSQRLQLGSLRGVKVSQAKMPATNRLMVIGSLRLLFGGMLAHAPFFMTSFLI